MADGVPSTARRSTLPNQPPTRLGRAFVCAGEGTERPGAAATSPRSRAAAQNSARSPPGSGTTRPVPRADPSRGHGHTSASRDRQGTAGSAPRSPPRLSPCRTRRGRQGTDPR